MNDTVAELGEWDTSSGCDHDAVAGCSAVAELLRIPVGK